MSHKILTDTPFAHRGLHGPNSGHVENTLSAFQSANAKGHGFELDILLSRDNKAMAYHDLSLSRLTGRDGNLQDFTAAQLSSIRLTGTDDVILTLDNVLKNIDQNLPVLIEIKGDQEQADEIAEAVYNDICDYTGPIAIMSFYPDIVSWFQKNAPTILRGLVGTSIKEEAMPAEFFSAETQKLYIDNLAVDFIAYDILALPNEVTEYCRGKNMPVLTWTVRSEKLRQKAHQYTDNIIYENLD